MRRLIAPVHARLRSELELAAAAKAVADELGMPALAEKVGRLLGSEASVR